MRRKHSRNEENKYKNLKKEKSLSVPETGIR